MKITRQSTFSGKVRTMDLDITNEQILKYESGELLQDAFPNLTDDEREFFKSGITKEEWNNLFS